MSQDDQITVRGFVTAEPRLWQRTAERPPVATIRVGSTRRKLNRETGEWQDGETSYYTVKCWRRLAENVHGSLRKGDMVFVRGRVVTRNWLDDQQRVRTEVLIEADSVGHDLAFGWSRFNRGLHTPPGAVAGIAQGEAIRQGMGPDPELPDDYPFIDDRDEAGPAGDVTGHDVTGERGAELPGGRSEAADNGDNGDDDGDGAAGRDDYGFAALASDIAQPADAGASL